MVASVSGTLPLSVVALPFASAVLLALVGSWRIGTWINAGSVSLLFLLTCLLPWHPRIILPLLHVGVAETQLVLLTALVAMTTGWFSLREIPAALAARALDRRRVRLYHVACQGLLGAIVLALLSDNPALTWLALGIAVAAAAAVTGVVHGQAAAAAASRLVLLCSVGLMLALLGTLLLHMAAGPHAAWGRLQASSHHEATMHLAWIFLVLGYGALAGVVPLHHWLPDAASEGVAPGAIIVGVLMVNAPLLVLMRLRSAVGLSAGLPAAMLTTLGVVTLLLCACCLLAPSGTRRSVAFAGMAQVGIMVVAIGAGGPTATFAGSLHMTLLALARAAVLQCHGLRSTRMAAWTGIASVLALALLPLFALFLIAGAMVWLLLPLGAGVLLTAWVLLVRLPMLVPPVATPRGGDLSEVAALAPIWLQLGLVVLLAFAMPGPLVDWFNGVATAR
jgi:hydrogenase-4 component F